MAERSSHGSRRQPAEVGGELVADVLAGGDGQQVSGLQLLSGVRDDGLAAPVNRETTAP